MADTDGSERLIAVHKRRGISTKFIRYFSVNLQAGGEALNSKECFVLFYHSQSRQVKALQIPIPLVIITVESRRFSSLFLTSSLTQLAPFDLIGFNCSYYRLPQGLVVDCPLTLKFLRRSSRES